jgi:hypothetical protein
MMSRLRDRPNLRENVSQASIKGMTTLPCLKPATQKNPLNLVRQTPHWFKAGQFLGCPDGPPSVFMRLACADGLREQIVQNRSATPV